MMLTKEEIEHLSEIKKTSNYSLDICGFFPYERSLGNNDSYLPSNDIKEIDNALYSVNQALKHLTGIINKVLKQNVE